MSETTLIADAAAPLAEIVRNIKPDQLAAPTPCTEYDVRGLVNHLLFWGPSLEGAARKESVPPPAATEQEADLTVLALSGPRTARPRSAGRLRGGAWA